MLALQPHHITDLYVLIDDLIDKPHTKKVGRPATLSDAEVITILLWNTMVLRQQTLKDIYCFAQMYHTKDFPKLPHYNKSLEHCHRVIPLLHLLLQYTLTDTEPIRILDSTMLEVCKLVRADRHKVARNSADFGKNHQGWHFGFKLHASCNLQGKLCALLFTEASFSDTQAMPYLVDSTTRIGVGDTLYGAKVMGEFLYRTFGTLFVAPPHYTQKKKVMSLWQYKLLRMRPKIETVFDYLKNHLHLVTSFPRSVRGYVLHYLKTLLGYQLLVG